MENVATICGYTAISKHYTISAYVSPNRKLVITYIDTVYTYANAQIPVIMRRFWYATVSDGINHPLPNI